MTHAPINQITAKLRQVSVQLVKVEAERTQFMEQVIVYLDTLETHINALESGAMGRVQGKKSSQGGANKHKSLKVSHHQTLPEMLC